MVSVQLPPLALTMGEPAGIGGDIALSCWLDRAALGTPAFFLLDNPDRLEALTRRLNISAPIVAIKDPSQTAEVFGEALPVMPLESSVRAEPGKLDVANAPAIMESIERGVELAVAGQASALVTNPIHKASLYDAGFKFPGHTEYLAHLAGDNATPVMMLACPGLRVVPVTIHVSLRQAADSLSTEAIVSAGRITAASLKTDFGIDAPRLVVAGLNPHAGENGAMGDEETTIIGPAIEELRDLGIDAIGPLSADTLFHARARQTYDAALCMYHDQALIPLKTIDFDHGVNITLGLPFIRTSPDHGTALDIAGAGSASPSSLLAALKLAAEMATRRYG